MLFLEAIEDSAELLLSEVALRQRLGEFVLEVQITRSAICHWWPADSQRKIWVILGICSLHDLEIAGRAQNHSLRRLRQ